jgi:hypothetical protein
MVWGQIAGAVIGGMMAQKGAKKQNKENRIATAKQMAFQREMSNTAYQRGMTDMQKAGLNPILAGKMGGASTPGGATYQAQNVGQAGQQAFANVANVMASTAKLRAETAQIKEKTQITKETKDSPIIKTTDVIGERVNKAKNKFQKGSFYKGSKTKAQQALDKIQSYAIKKAIKKSGSKTIYKGKKVYPDRIMRTK